MMIINIKTLILTLPLNNAYFARIDHKKCVLVGRSMDAPTLTPIKRERVDIFTCGFLQMKASLGRPILPLDAQSCGGTLYLKSATPLFHLNFS